MGLLNNEDLKAGEGNPNWLRLFELVASEFALAEKCPLIPGTHGAKRNARLREICELEKKLGARWFIKLWNLAITETERLIAPGSKYFLIQFQSMSNDPMVDVRGYSKFEEGSKIEQQLTRNTVVVAVDKVENLREAYPNYYLDMTLFLPNLNRIIDGRPLIHALQAVAEDDLRDLVTTTTDVRGINAMDLSWINKWDSTRRRRR